jgi:hypothetical protein
MLMFVGRWLVGLMLLVAVAKNGKRKVKDLSKRERERVECVTGRVREQEREERGGSARVSVRE